jgi:hypothetical protein
MDFLDFQLRAWQASEKQVQVLVHSSPVGAMRQPVKVPFKMATLKAICDLVRNNWLSEAGMLQRVVEAGKQLSEILLPPEVYTYLLRSLERVGEDGLRLRLCLDDALIDAPWEFLHRPDALEDELLDGFLALNSHLSLVREAPVESSKLEPSEKQQRMVILGAYQADGGDPWQVEDERRKLIKALEPVQKFLMIDDRFRTAAGNYIEDALSTPVSVFHYSGHVDVENGRGFLVREITNSSSSNDVCNSSDFSPLFSDRKLDVLLRRSGARIAVLSACNSGRWPFVEPLLKAGLPAFVGVQGSTSCDAATAFCQKLYSSLAVGLSLDEAVIYARLHLQEDGVVVGRDSCEWGSYMVYMPTTEAVLLPKPKEQPQVQEQQEEVRRTASELQSKRSLRVAILKEFNEEELDLLCADLEEDLKIAGKDLEVDLEIAGGTTKEGKILKLIEYLEHRNCLPSLLTAVRRARPEISI